MKTVGQIGYTLATLKPTTSFRVAIVVLCMTLNSGWTITIN